MRITLWSVGAVLLFAIILNSCCDAQEPRQGKRLADILPELRAARSSVQSAQLTVRTVLRSDIAENDLHKFSGRIELTDATSEFAFRGPARFLRTTSRSKPFSGVVVPGAGNCLQTLPGAAAPPREMPKEEKNEKRVTYVYDGERYYAIRNGVSQVLSQENVDSTPSFFFSVDYLRYVGWYIPDPSGPEALEKKRLLDFFPNSFADISYSESFDSTTGLMTLERPIPESDGKVVEQLLLDSQFGWMLARREFRSSNEDRRLLARVVCSNPLRVVDGFWVPGHVVVEEFAPEDATEYSADRLWTTTVMDTTVNNVNQVADSVFVPQLDPRSLLVDTTSIAGELKAGQRPDVRPVSANAAHSDQVVDNMKAGSSGWPWLACLNVAVIVAVIVIVCFRRWPGR